MYRILVPVDGSDVALRAVGHAIRMARLIGEADIHLVNVQPPVSGSLGTFVGNEDAARFHLEESENATADARKLMEREGMPVHAELRIGPTSQSIADYANELPCDEIVMGTRGLGRIGSLVLGSVATQVVHLTEFPVTLIK